jgi:hypothetical protein
VNIANRGTWKLLKDKMCVGRVKHSLVAKDARTYPNNTGKYK